MNLKLLKNNKMKLFLPLTKPVFQLPSLLCVYFSACVRTGVTTGGGGFFLVVVAT